VGTQRQRDALQPGSNEELLPGRGAEPVSRRRSDRRRLSGRQEANRQWAHRVSGAASSCRGNCVQTKDRWLGRGRHPSLPRADRPTSAGHRAIAVDWRVRASRPPIGCVWPSRTTIKLVQRGPSDAITPQVLRTQPRGRGRGARGSVCRSHPVAGFNGLLPPAKHPYRNSIGRGRGPLNAHPSALSFQPGCIATRRRIARRPRNENTTQLAAVSSKPATRMGWRTILAMQNSGTGQLAGAIPGQVAGDPVSATEHEEGDLEAW
jgi:hypothetical protein